MNERFTQFWSCFWNCLVSASQLEVLVTWCFPSREKITWQFLKHDPKKKIIHFNVNIGSNKTFSNTCKYSLKTRVSSKEMSTFICMSKVRVTCNLWKTNTWVKYEYWLNRPQLCHSPHCELSCYHQPTCLALFYAGGREAVHQCNREPPTDGTVLYFTSEDATTSGGQILPYIFTRIQVLWIQYCIHNFTMNC